MLDNARAGGSETIDIVYSFTLEQRREVEPLKRVSQVVSSQNGQEGGLTYDLLTEFGP